MLFTILDEDEEKRREEGGDEGVRTTTDVAW